MSTYHFNPSKANKTTTPIVSKQNPSHNTKREIAKLYIEISAIENKLATLKNKAESLKAQIQTDEFMNDVLATESSLMQSIYDVFKGRDDIVHLQPDGPDGIVAFIAGLENYGLDMERLEDYDFEIVITDRKKSHDKNEDDSSVDNTSKNPTTCPCIMCSDECEGMDFCTKYKKYEQYVADKYSKIDNHKDTNKPPKMDATKKESSPSTSTLEDRVSSTVKSILNSPYLSYIEEYLNDMFPDRPPTREEMRNLYKEWAKKCNLGKYCVDKTCGDCVLGPYD